MDLAKTKADQKGSSPKPSVKNPLAPPSSATLVESGGAKEGGEKASEDKGLSAATAAEGSKDSSLKAETKPLASSPPPPATSAAGVPSAGGQADIEVQKKLRRAERFGMPVNLSEEEKRSSRAQRFGAPSSHGSAETTKSEDDKRKARAERFGLSAKAAVDEEAKKKARVARFAPAPKVDPLEEDKRKARAIRFAKPASDEKSAANGQPKTEILGPVV